MPDPQRIDVSRNKATNITNFCTANQIKIGSHLRARISEPDFATEVIEHVVQKALNQVPGAKDLVRTVAKLDGSKTEIERKFLNHITECFGTWFLEMKLGHQITEIEARTNPIRSAFARNKAKSCDIRSRDTSEIDRYVEIKDHSVDFERMRRSGLRGFPPATNLEKRKWLERKLKESFAKGANILLVRTSVWMRRNGQQSVEDSILDILGKHQRISANHVKIRVNFTVPAWFEATYLIKRTAHVKVTVEKA